MAELIRPIWPIGLPNVQIDRTTKFKVSTEHPNSPDWPDKHVRLSQSVHQMSRLTEPPSSKCQLNTKLVRLAGLTHPIWPISPPNIQIDRTTKFKMSTEHQTYSIGRITTSDMTNWSTKLTLNSRINQSNKPHGSSIYSINQTFQSDMVN